MKLNFLGAAETVTGSKYLIESSSDQRILIDCGMFQGLKTLRLKNWEEFPVDPKTINAIVLTHAHIDHSGYIPRLVKQGFKGDIYCTDATYELCEILLYDSASIKEEDAKYARKKNFSKHKSPEPLYTTKDVERSLGLFRTVSYGQGFEIGDFKVQFQYAGHILGAASALIKVDSKSLFFTGDLGRANDLLMYPPKPLPNVDYLIMESTYGNRCHGDVDPLEALKEIILKARKNKSTLMIPSFAVGRTQLILYCLEQIFKKEPDLKMPVYLNSPMATEVTSLYQSYCQYHKIHKDECRSLSGGAHFVKSVEESKKLNENTEPKIIIAGSGMISGGRILHHLQAFGADPKNIILLVGFQAMGTRGAALKNGEKELKMHGRYFPIEASIENLDIYSAHADQNELLDWLGSSDVSPGKVFLVHGEAEAADILRRKIEERYGFDVQVATSSLTVMG